MPYLSGWHNFERHQLRQKSFTALIPVEDEAASIWSEQGAPFKFGFSWDETIWTILNSLNFHFLGTIGNCFKAQFIPPYALQCKDLSVHYFA